MPPSRTIWAPTGRSRTAFWFYLVIGQQNGLLAALVLQLFWAVGINAVAWILPTIIHAASNGHTLHGFLGAFYQSQLLRRTFALLACFYYLLLFAFEVVCGGNIIAKQLSPDPRLAIILAGFMTMLPAIYISVSGFKGNVAGDRLQNRVGTMSCVSVWTGTREHSSAHDAWPSVEHDASGLQFSRTGHRAPAPPRRDRAHRSPES